MMADHLNQIHLKGEISFLNEKNMENLHNLLEQVDNFSNSEKENIRESINYYTRQPSDDEFMTIGFFIQDELSGLLCYGKGLGNNTYEVYWIGVAKKHQGKAIGSRLLTFMEKNLKSKNARIIFIETESKKNYFVARKLYEKLGYKKNATIKKYFNEDSDKIVYSKEI